MSTPHELLNRLPAEHFTDAERAVLRDAFQATESPAGAPFRDDITIHLDQVLMEVPKRPSPYLPRSFLEAKYELYCLVVDLMREAGWGRATTDRAIEVRDVIDAML
jgi:hypothetical protein